MRFKDYYHVMESLEQYNSRLFKILARCWLKRKKVPKFKTKKMYVQMAKWMEKKHPILFQRQCEAADWEPPEPKIYPCGGFWS